MDVTCFQLIMLEITNNLILLKHTICIDIKLIFIISSDQSLVYKLHQTKQMISDFFVSELFL